MMSVTLLCVGKLREKWLKEACAEYTKRLAAYCRLSIVELPEEKLPERPAEALRTAALQREAERVLAAVPQGAALVALCIEGRLFSSEELSSRLTKWQTEGESRLALVIGGSEGLDEAVKRRARLKLSMSPMTFPHHLARVLVLEQLYRAFSIAAGGKYHK